MREERYDSEDLLQTLLAKYPELLAGDEVGERRWLLVKREVPVPDRETGGSRWSLDHVFVDQEAVPTLVEVKRSTDTRIRREVVGQMLDYAANGVVYWPPGLLRAQFESRCEENGQEPEEVFLASLGDELDPARFWAEVEQNLRSGNVRLLFISDLIPRELRRVIEFLNERMSPTVVLGIEIKQYVGEGDLKTLVPRIVGETEQARVQKIGGGRTSVDVDWGYYEEWLQPQRLAMVREAYKRMENAISERGLPWPAKLKRSYLAFGPPADNRCGIDIKKRQPFEFWIKAPVAMRPRGEDIPGLYPHLKSRWYATWNLWYWEVPTLEAIPDMAPAIELASR
jgi:hypothetical protein